MEIKILEGQSSAIKIVPTFEGKSIIDRISVDWTRTDMKGMVLLGRDMTGKDKRSAFIPVIAQSISVGTGIIVFKYMDSHKDTENVGTVTKEVAIRVLPALLTVAHIDPSTLKWLPGREYDIAISWLNGTQSILATDGLLNLSTTGDSISIVSRNKDGVRIKVREDVDANLLPSKEQVVVAKYYSGLARSILTFRLKPTLVITPAGLINLKGKGSVQAFPFKVMDGTKDVTKLIKNIRATDEYLRFNDDGSFVVIKVNLLAIVRTISYTFDYEVDGLVWTYGTKVNVTIGNLINI
jgi:hypothetical protein